MSDTGAFVIPAGLVRWAEVNRVATRPVAMTSARAAMHAARLTARAPSPRRFGVAVPKLDALRRHQLRLTAGSMAAAVALVIAVGWDASPGTPLHPIQLARENVSLALAGANQAIELRLDYAEARLRDAASGSNRHDSLAEAAGLLDAVGKQLPSNPADPLWQRWSHDESLLAALATPVQPSPAAESPAGGSGDDGAGGADAMHDRSGRGVQGGDDSSGGTPGGVATTAPTEHSADGGDSGRLSAPAAPLPTGDGGVDGGGSGGGGGTSTPQPSPTAGDGGHGGDG
jgi:hypothetical protein